MTKGVYIVGIGSSSSSRLGIWQNVIPFQQPLEDVVFGDAALHRLQAPALLELGVDLSRVHLALGRLLGDPVVEILLRGSETLFFRNRLDDEIAADLPLRHRTEFSGELLPLRLRNLVGLGVVLYELLYPALWNVERVG